jgi:hypothetical protein
MFDAVMFDEAAHVRTTVDIADDVLAASKSVAREQGKSLGEVLSELARKGLRKPVSKASRNGVPLLKVKNPSMRVTLEIVNALRDEAP